MPHPKNTTFLDRCDDLDEQRSADNCLNHDLHDLHDFRILVLRVELQKVQSFEQGMGKCDMKI